MQEDITIYFKDLKKSMEGLNNYYFLVNDSNNEIRQHYDINYKSPADINRLIKSINSKNEYFKENNINYAFIVIPDKSISMRKYLPFETDNPKRIVDKLTGHVNDVNPIITDEDILKNDTHISYKSSLKIVSYILSILNNNEMKYYYEKLEDKLDSEIIDHKGDLFFDMNWSYPKDKRFIENAHINIEKLIPKDEYVQIKNEDIPEQFRYVSRRESLHYINPHSISDKKAVIIRDSSTDKLINTFITYYREVFFYWDHWYFNKDLIEYFKPDDVIEIRTERFLNNPKYPVKENNLFVKQKLLYDIKQFGADDRKLSINIGITDYTKLTIDTTAKIYVDNELLGSTNIIDGLLEFSYDLSDYKPSLYEIKIVVDGTSRTVETVIDKTISITENIYKYFNNLKTTLKGKDEIFFLVNDANHEIIQHYDLEYKSPLNLHEFKKSITSKRNYLTKRNILFTQFIIPDKSIMLRKYLPFETPEPIRHIDNLRNFFYDLSDVLDENDYLVNDTKINMEAAVKAVAYIIYKTFKKDGYENILDNISQRIYLKSELFDGDLFTDHSWSYEKDELYEKYAYTYINKVFLKDDVISNDVPDAFKIFNSSKSEYYTNNNSICDKFVIVLADKSIYPLINPLIAYFKHVFVYYDEWYFNKDLINYYSPDAVIEIRAERILDNPLTKHVSENSNILIPVKMNITQFAVDDSNLKISLYCEDLRKIPIESTCKFYMDDDVVIKEEGLVNGCCNLTMDLSDCSYGNHTLKIRLEESEYTKAKLISKEFSIK